MKLYEKGSINIWSDPYIRKQLLCAHINPESDAASRKPDTINTTIDWVLKNRAAPGSLIDFGCGPGLYANEISERGWHVVGIDINEESVEYAERYAASKGLSARYVLGSYLEKLHVGIFDIVTCIYCDFGALTPDDRMSFLENVKSLLTVDGTFVLDVFGEQICQIKSEGRSWSREEEHNFWSESPCYVLTECQHFKEHNVWGEKYVVIPDTGQPFSTVIWTHYFTVESIALLLADSGFNVTEINQDLVQESDFSSSEVIFIRAEKSNPINSVR